MKAYEKVRKLMEEKDLDSVLVTDEYNRRYVSGFSGSSAVLFLTKSSQYILTDFRYVEQVGRECPDFVCIDVAGRTYVQALNELIAQENVLTLGYEDQTISLVEYRKYKADGIQKELVGLGDSLERLRIVKEDWELKYLERAEEIGDIAFKHILDVIKPGITEKEIAIELEFAMRRAGAEGLSFDSIIASGVNSSLPHANPTDKKIENGDFVTMDFGCIYNGYCSDMTRTIVVGKPNDEQKRIYETVLKAQLESLAAVHAGVTGVEIDKIARDIIYGAGYEGRFGHGLGHSVGLFIHEEPRFSTACKEVIQPNTIMTVEPGIYIPDFGGVRIEDMICVTEDGYKNFAHSPKELICL